MDETEEEYGGVAGGDHCAASLRYRVEVPGYRVREITLVTTLRDAAIYPAEALAELYFRRWQVEINIKTS